MLTSALLVVATVTMAVTNAGEEGAVPAEDYEIEFGKAAVVREGRDHTVVALGLMIWKTIEACDRLASRGISVEVIDPRTVSPFDTCTFIRFEFSACLA